MPKPTEHKTVQARILAYAQEILLSQFRRQDYGGQEGYEGQDGWSLVTREEAERRRGIGNWKLNMSGCEKAKDSWSLDTPYFVARMICFKTEGACHV
jgi:hypothetical protein